MIKWNTDLGVDRLEKEKSVHLCRMKVRKITFMVYLQVWVSILFHLDQTKIGVCRR